VHPGYGFLSESAEFVDMCEEAGIAFLGPKSDTMRLFSRKHDARAFAENAKVPILSGKQALLHVCVSLCCKFLVCQSQGTACNSCIVVVVEFARNEIVACSALTLAHEGLTT